MTGRDLRGRILLSLGFVLLAVAWVFSNPPGSAPDEPEHYIRAVSVGRLHFLGDPTNQTVMRAEGTRQLRFLHSIAREVPVPAELAAPDSWFCTVIDHDVSAACVNRVPAGPAPIRQPTYVGAYEPYPYLPMGFATLLAHDPTSALLLARLANMAIAMAFVVASVALVWEVGETSTIGVVLAVTPMVIFTSAVASPSALEVSASICLVTAAVRLWRDPASTAGAFGAGISAFVLGTMRPLGPVWVLSGALLIALLLRRAGLAKLARSSPRRVGALVGLVLVGVAGNLAWQLAVLPPGPRPLADIASFIGPSFASLAGAFGEAIGYFGWQDVLMPRPAYAVWSGVFILLLVGALMVGRRRDLRSLEVVLLGGVALTLTISAVAVMPTGYAIRGRYILPAVVAVIVVAGEVVHRNRDRAPAPRLRALVLIVAAVASVLQVVGWYTMAHRYAVGLSGPWLFLGRAEWEPPLGWATWLVVVVVGAACVAAGAGLFVAGSSPPPTDSRFTPDPDDRQGRLKFFAVAPQVTIGGIEVGRAHPPLVVAELSGNHLGSLDRAERLVEEAARAGAHAVKFQTFSADSLTLDLDTEMFVVQEPLWRGRRMHDLFDEVAMPMEWHRPLIKLAAAHGLVWFSSAFDVAGVYFLDDLDVPAIKIASSELVDLELISAAAATGRPVLVSTGMGTEDEINDAVLAARQAGCRELFIFRCSAAYPAPEDELDLATLPVMEERWECPVGFSDHTLGSTAAIAAVALGASAIEKHLTLRRADGGADGAFSTEPEELQQLVQGVASAYRARGGTRFGPTPSEIPALAGRRSLFVVRDVAAGEAFTTDNVRSIRPADGLPPKELPRVLQHRARHAVERGTPLSWDLIGP